MNEIFGSLHSTNNNFPYTQRTRQPTATMNCARMGKKLLLQLLLLCQFALLSRAFVSLVAGPLPTTTTTTAAKLQPQQLFFQRNKHLYNNEVSSSITSGCKANCFNMVASSANIQTTTSLYLQQSTMNENEAEDSSAVPEDNDDDTKNDDDKDDSAMKGLGAVSLTDTSATAVEPSPPVKQQSQQQQQQKQQLPKPRKFVIVGAGWGGWGAAQTLVECSNQQHQVILLDALPDPTGRTPYLSRTGKPVEAGTRGFWKDYPNINRLCAELQLQESDVFTDFTNSSFYSPDGLEATAPVFSNAQIPKNSLPFLSQWSGQKLPPLPSPLGQILATFPLFERLPLSDRASMVGLLLSTVDVWAGDEDCRAAYDRMTAHELFRQFGLSERLVRDFITPTLLVGLFQPPHELSALVVMELLYYYALAHTDSFDVRWIRNGTVADSLLAPLADRLLQFDPQQEQQQKQQQPQQQDESSWSSNDRLQILGGCRVTRIGTAVKTNSEDNRLEVHEIEYIDSQTGQSNVISDVDGVILAVTARGMQSIVQGSPALARGVPSLAQAATCRGIDVLSVRLWLDRTVPTRTPANVWARFDELRGAGGTFFMLDQLQSSPSAQQALWGGGSEQQRGSVVACDFYNAGALLALSDDDLVNTILSDLLPAAVPAFADAQLVDQWVGRYPGAVSWFAPGSYTKRPPLEPPGIDNLKCAGDWVRLPAKLEEESAKGLCQERAYASGMHAANALLRQVYGDGAAVTKTVLPVRPDEAQFRAAVEISRRVMKVLPRFWVR